MPARPDRSAEETASLRPRGESLMAHGPGPASGGVMLEKPGDFVGPYKLMSVLGEGGFGTVWLAERREPMVQRVALKIIKPGMDSRSVIARFEQERQALAVMDHPNVARVFDGGVTERGRPYFVMEHVQGEPITTFCDRHTYTIRQRLELFIPVCEAVQHAHMKGIIHRDIKPSNVLVSIKDGNAIVKVIDFGIAKAISHTMTDKTIFTETGQLIGTPEYMSPEQAEMGAVDIDTRTDVYSLGVVLYELLVGALPFDAKELRARGYAEIQRVIREVEPPTPSKRLTTIDEEAGAAIAMARQGVREKIAGELRRELEWIPLMAMRKDRSRRYASAESLAADLLRYLEGTPLEAAPESRAYLARKFVRRNRVQVTATGAVVFALVLGLAGTFWQAREAARQRDAEKERAEQLKRVSDFQTGMLGQIDTTKAGVDLMADVRDRFAAALEKAGVPEGERTHRVDALRQELFHVNATDTAAAMIDRTILRPAIKTIDEEFEDDPATDASLRQALADLYCSIGLYDAAFPLQESALATRRRELGEEHPDTLISIAGMGFLLHAQGKFAEAEPYFREDLEMARRVLGEEHPETLISINNLGSLLLAQGKLDEAEPFRREDLEKSRRVLGNEHPDTLTSINNMGVLLEAQGKLDQAEPYWREALEKRRRVLGEEHPSTLISINNMGFLLRAQGKLAEAEPYHREALEKFRRVLGEENPSTLRSINNMGALLQDQGRFPEAEPYRREALEKRRRVLGEEHPDTLTSLNDMGFLLEAQGKLAEAEPYYREAVEKFRLVLGEENPSTLTVTCNLGRLLQQQGKHRNAIELLAPIEPAAHKAFTGSNARYLAEFLATLGRARVGLGLEAERFALAESNLLEAHEIYLAANDRGSTHKDTLDCVHGLVELYEAWHSAEPEKGYDAKAAEWRAKLDAAGDGE